MTRLAVIEIPENAGRDLAVEQEILGADVQIEHIAFHGDSKTLPTLCGDADIVMTDFVPFTRATLQQLGDVKMVSVAATGFSNIDVEAAAELGISVIAIDEYCTNEVADHTLTLLLAVGRRLIDYDRQVRQECRWQFDSLAGLPRFGDLTLGLIGFGRIGRAVAKRAASFGMTIIVHDPYIDAPSAAQAGASLCSLQEIYERSDIISLHSALTAGSRHLLDAAAFANMAKAPILINVARGELIDEAALVAALDSGQVSAAGLDVLADESPDLAAHPLHGRDNVIMTPHVAFYSDSSMLDNRRISASNIRHFIDGEHAQVRKYIHKGTRKLT